ncbi:hypothetical protein GQX74_013146 [Glossina fuscipes]|nr:hypothetical protein GQX74_013146 [Glossina fuscipes]
MNAVCRATWRAQVTKLCNIASNYLKTFEGMQYGKVSGSRGMQSKISIYLQRLCNAHSNLRKADEAMKPQIKSKECEAVFEYDGNAITIKLQLQNILPVHFKQTSERTAATSSNGELENRGRFVAVQSDASPPKKFVLRDRQACPSDLSFRYISREQHVHS